MIRASEFPGFHIVQGTDGKIEYMYSAHLGAEYGELMELLAEIIRNNIQVQNFVYEDRYVLEIKELGIFLFIKKGITSEVVMLNNENNKLYKVMEPIGEFIHLFKGWYYTFHKLISQ